MTDESSTETTEAPAKKKNRPRHVTMMEKEYERVAEKYEQTVVEFSNVTRARAALSGGTSTDETFLATCAELATSALEDQKAADAEDGDGDVA